MKIKPNARGFAYGEFTDLYGSKCSLQKSSLAGTDAIWLGINDANPRILRQGEGWVNYPIPKEVLLSTRMHLTREDVKYLLPYLMEFARTGEVRQPKKKKKAEKKK